MPGWKSLTNICQGYGDDRCGYGDLVTLVDHLINNLVLISTLVVVVVLIYSGFELITSMGKQSAWTDFKERMWKVMVGYVWILVAWVIVYTITDKLLKSSISLLGN